MQLDHILVLVDVVLE